MRVLVVTGLSGAGRTSALRALEDVGFRAVDNLPATMLPALVEQVEDEDLAVGVDSRGLRTLDGLEASVAAVRRAGHSVEILFLTAPDEVLIRRYSETRRRHPMGTVPDSIRRERIALAPLGDQATQTVDTETMSARELRRVIRDRYGHGAGVRLVLASFGFKHALPREADLVFDARGLDNPYHYPDLRLRSGFHQSVREFVLAQPLADELLGTFERHVRLQVPASQREGRSYLTVAIGCTGGQHRSVVLTEALAVRLREGKSLADGGIDLDVRHRDVDTKGDSDDG
jgi:UPF0042 nucleotide-binding protein